MQTIASRLLWIVVFLVPLDRVFILPQFGTITKLVGIPALVAGLVLVVGRGRLRAWPVNTMLLYGVAFVSIASILWSRGPQFSVRLAITDIQLVGLVWLLIEVPRTVREVDHLVMAYVLGCLGAALKLLREHALGEYYALNYLVERYSAFGSDPNYLAVTLSVGVALAWYLALTETARRRLLWQGVLAVLALASVLTGSRGGFLSCVVALAVIPLSLASAGRKERIAIAFFMCVGIYFGGQALLASDVWARLETISGELFGGGTFSGRLPLWIVGLETFVKYPVLGVGAGSYRMVTAAALPEGDVAHNTFLSVLVELGLIGFSLFVAMFVQIIRDLRRLPFVRRVPLAGALASWGVGALSLTLEHSKFTWVLIGFIATFAAFSQRNGVAPKLNGE